MCTTNVALSFASIARAASRAFESATAELAWASSNDQLTARLRRDDARARRDNLYALAALRDIARRNGTELVNPGLRFITDEDVAAAACE